MERECVYKEGMTVSVWGFHHWTQGEVVWTCSLLYLWWWSNRPWKALLLNYPTGISPLIHRKRGTERDDGWMRKVMSGRRREGKGRWEGGKEREMFIVGERMCKEVFPASFKSGNWSNLHSCLIESHFPVTYSHWCPHLLQFPSDFEVHIHACIRTDTACLQYM